MLDHAGGAGRSDPARGDRHAGAVQFLSPSGDPGENGDDRRRGERWALDPGCRRRLARAGVSGVRVALRSSRGPLRRSLADPGALLHEGHVDFAGQYYQARNCDIVPRGPRKAGPPLLVGSEGPRMLKLTAQYADLWNIGYMGTPETMAEPLAKIEAACREIGRDPATVGITALIGLWFPDLQAQQPSFLDHPLTGTVQEIAAAMRGYAELGVQHIMFQCWPYNPQARVRLTEALQLYRGMEQQ